MKAVTKVVDQGYGVFKNVEDVMQDGKINEDGEGTNKELKKKNDECNRKGKRKREEESLFTEKEKEKERKTD